MPGARVADPLRPPLPAVGGATPVAHMAPVARTRAPVVPVPHEGVVRRDGRRRGREGGEDHQATRTLGRAVASPAADPPLRPPLTLLRCRGPGVCNRLPTRGPRHIGTLSRQRHRRGLRAIIVLLRPADHHMHRQKGLLPARLRPAGRPRVPRGQAAGPPRAGRGSPALPCRGTTYVYRPYGRGSLRRGLRQLPRAT